MRQRKQLFTHAESGREWAPDVRLLDEQRPTREGASSPSLQFWLGNAVGFVRKLLSGMSHWRLTRIRLEGTVDSEGKSLTVDYVGHGENLEYFCRLFFKGPVRQQALSTHPIWHQGIAGKEAGGADLYCLERPLPWSLMAAPPGSKNYLCWVKQGIPIEANRDAFINTMRRKTRMEAERVIRKYALSVSLVSAQDFGATFYRELYRPYIESRFGEEGVIVSEAQFLAKCAHARLLLVKQGDTPVGGLVLHQQGTTLIDGWTGIRLQDGAPLVPGISDVIDYCSLYLAYQEGFSHLDMGTSRAFLSDGTLKYKLRWGARLSTGVVPKGTWTLALATTRPEVLDMINRAGIIGRRPNHGLVVCQVDDDGMIQDIPLTDRLS